MGMLASYLPQQLELLGDNLLCPLEGLSRNPGIPAMLSFLISEKSCFLLRIGSGTPREYPDLQMLKFPVSNGTVFA